MKTPTFYRLSFIYFQIFLTRVQRIVWPVTAPPWKKVLTNNIMPKYFFSRTLSAKNLVVKSEWNFCWNVYKIIQSSKFPIKKREKDKQNLL